MLEKMRKALSGKKQTDWKAIVRKVQPEAKFYDPAADRQIEEAEKTLGCKLPSDLRSFLKTSNGLGFSESDAYPFVKTLDEIVEENQEYWNDPFNRENYMPLDCLLFFGSPGVDGIQFAYPYSGKRPLNKGIFSWNPYDDGRTWMAPGLATFFEWWFTNKIHV